MKLKVPFLKQTTGLNCGPVALQMILSYFGGDPGLGVLEERVGIKEGKGVSTIQIALASKLSGFKTKLLTKTLEFDESHMETDFYKKYKSEMDDIEKLVARAREIGVGLEKKEVELDELLGNMSEDSLIIVLLDWDVVKGQIEKGYQGHFVVVTGWDDENVYVHNHGLNDSEEDVGISRGVFDTARKAKGTDEDFVVVYRKD